MDGSAIDRKARVADGLVLLVAAAAIPAVHWFPGSEKAGWIVVGVVLGALARFAAHRAAPRVELGVTSLALGAVVVRVASRWVDDLSYAHVPPSAVTITAIDLALPALAIFAMLRGPRYVPFAVGILWASSCADWRYPVATSATAIAFALGRGALGSTAEPARQRASSLGAGACAGMAVLALGFDASSLQLAPAAVYAGSHDATILRMVLETLALVGAIELAAGRTRGLLVLALAGSALFAAVVTTSLPHWGGECYPFFHPLHEPHWIDGARPSAVIADWITYRRPPLVLGLVLAIAPWALPVLRALWPGSRREHA